MPLRIGCIAFALAAVSLLAVSAAAADADPAAGTRAFWDVYLRARIPGVPSAAKRKQLDRVISPRLSDLIQRAADAEVRHLAATKNREPPLAEGDLFTSLFEGATRYRVVACNEAGERAECTVELAYRAPHAPTSQTWRDRTLLVREGTHFVVDDIAYGGTWDFGNKGTLGATLAEIARWQP